MDYKKVIITPAKHPANGLATRGEKWKHMTISARVWLLTVMEATLVHLFFSDCKRELGTVFTAAKTAM